MPEGSVEGKCRQPYLPIGRVAPKLEPWLPIETQTLLCCSKGHLHKIIKEKQACKHVVSTEN